MLNGFRYAFRGLTVAWMKGKHFKIEVLSALIVLVGGLFLQLSTMDFMVLILVISSVLATETFNTALEELCDKFEPSHDQHIAKIKDLSAAAVLVTSLGAAGVGIIIFAPHIW